jgi:hypothetical protein
VGAIMSLDAHTVGNRADLGLPVVEDGGLVVVAIVDEGFGIELERPTAAQQAIVNVGCVGAWLHPDALFEQGVGEGVAPDGRGAFEMKAFQVAQPFLFDRGIGPAVGEEGEVGAVVFAVFVELSQQEGAAERRLEGGDEEAVVAAREQTGDRAHREAANAVGHQPFTALGNGQVATNFASELDHGCAPSAHASIVEGITPPGKWEWRQA